MGGVRAVGGVGGAYLWCDSNGICLQQHGSVYWRRGAAETLKQLDPAHRLHQLLQVSMHVCVCV